MTLPVANTLLLVDDAPDSLLLLGSILHNAGYRVATANSGGAALHRAATAPQPDLILLDVMMPHMDGYEVLGSLRENPATRDIPVIFLTALCDAHSEHRGLELGAADYLSKPVAAAVMLARVRAQLQAKSARDWLRGQNSLLEAEVARRLEENDLTQAVGIRALAHLAEARDPETGNHIRRTQGYVGLLATHLRRHQRFAGLIDDDYIRLLTRSAPLHDIGKVGIPDHILRKPGPLAAAEWAIMKTHARIGAEAIDQAERDIEKPVEFLALAKEIARWHHERWDGTGYPDGLAQEAIPLSARLMALADVFDALISPRVYKPAMSFEAARSIVADERGRHFDPDMVDAFLGAFADFVAVAQRHRDAGTALGAHLSAPEPCYAT